MASTVKMVFFTTRLELCRDFRSFMDAHNTNIEHQIWPCDSMERLRDIMSKQEPEFVVIDETTAYFDLKKFKEFPDELKKIPRFLLSNGTDPNAVEKAVREDGFVDVIIHPMDKNVFMEKLSIVLMRPMGSSKAIYIAKTELSGAVAKVFRVYEIAEYGCKFETDQDYQVGDLVNLWVDEIAKRTMLARIARIEVPTPGKAVRNYLCLFVGIPHDIQAKIRKQQLHDHVERKKE